MLNRFNKKKIVKLLRRKRVAVVILSWFLLVCLSSWFGIKAVGENLRSQVANTLEQRNHSWAEVSFYGRGRHALLYGEAPDIKSKGDALAAIENVWGVSSVTFRGQIIPAVLKPASFSLAMVDEAVQVDGRLSANGDFASVLKGLEIIAGGRRLVNLIELDDEVELMPELLPLVMKLQCCTSLSLVKFEDSKLVVTGRVYSELEKTALEKSVDVIFSDDIEKVLKIKMRPIEKDLALKQRRCQREVNRILSIEALEFEESISVIRDGSAPLLALLADTMRQCEAKNFVLTNHLSARGSNRINIALSRARASSFKQGLADLGIAEEMMISVGKLQAIAGESFETSAKLRHSDSENWITITVN